MRAGIRAAIEAIRDAISHQRQFLLWIISMYTTVSRGMQANAVSVQGLSIMTMTFAKGTLFHLVHRASHLLLDVVKVVSHTDISQVEGEVDRWVVQGNATADRLAS